MIEKQLRKLQTCRLPSNCLVLAAVLRVGAAENGLAELKGMCTGKGPDALVPRGEITRALEALSIGLSTRIKQVGCWLKCAWTKYKSYQCFSQVFPSFYFLGSHLFLA